MEKPISLTLEEVAKGLKKKGLGIIDQSGQVRYRQLEEDSKEIWRFMAQSLGVEGAAKAQVSQDLFALLANGFKRNGFFVEFGAASGVEISNTYLLEKEFGWNGILAEPVPQWHKSIREHRSAILDTDCVWKTTGETLKIAVAPDAAFSTIETFRDMDQHGHKRINSTFVEVQSVSLNDLLERHEAPRQIDFLSIDTEGSELEILSHFDFDKYRVKVIACEHNYSGIRAELHKLLTSKGYKRKLQSMSLHDDWYVLEG